jgi:hypothetical protein
MCKWENVQMGAFGECASVQKWKWANVQFDTELI